MKLAILNWFQIWYYFLIFLIWKFHSLINSIFDYTELKWSPKIYVLLTYSQIRESKEGVTKTRKHFLGLANTSHLFKKMPLNLKSWDSSWFNEYGKHLQENLPIYMNLCNSFITISSFVLGELCNIGIRLPTTSLTGENS